MSWWRRLFGPGPAPIAGGSPAAAWHLLPEPALDWLRRANGAHGVWLADPIREDDELELVSALSGLRPDDPDALAAAGRVRVAANQERHGVERLESGTLVMRAGYGYAAALLLPIGADAAALRTAEADLDRLLEGMRRKPRVTPFRPGSASEAHLESIDSVAQRLALQLQRETGADALVLALLPSGPTVVGLIGALDARLKGVQVGEGSPLVQVGRVGEGPELSDDPVGGDAGDRRRRSRVAAVLPVAIEELRLGAVALWFPGVPTPESGRLARAEEIIRNAAPRFSRALEHLRLRAESQQDPLTGLPNRRGLGAAMRTVGVTSGAIVVCDLDRFKVLNDTLGHPAGDAALKHFARILTAQLREGDTPARIGGEEFAVWLPVTSLADATAIAERIRARLEASRFEWQGTPWPLTASFGVSACPETARHLENLIAQADVALYAAKTGGRNRVEQVAVPAA